MMISLVPDVTSWFAGVTHGADVLQILHGYLPLDFAVLDKPIQVDLAGDVQRAFNNFVRSGQVWAFLIGIALGYLVKTFTSYG
jgi:hypothetical protein